MRGDGKRWHGDGKKMVQRHFYTLNRQVLTNKQTDLNKFRYNDLKN